MSVEKGQYINPRKNGKSSYWIVVEKMGEKAAFLGGLRKWAAKMYTHETGERIFREVPNLTKNDESRLESE